MRLQRIAFSIALAGAFAALPLLPALFWPFCAAGAVVGAAATVVTAPVRAVTGWPYYYGRPYYPPPPYYGPQPYAYPPNYGQPQTPQQ